MNIDLHQRLEQKAAKKSFYQKYVNINRFLFYLSFFGNLASISMSYFFLYFILTTSVGAIFPSWVLIATTIILLTALEVLKREVFRVTTLNFLDFKNVMHNKVRTLALCSIILIGVSFYGAISGAHRLSSNDTKIANDKTEIAKKYEDSLRSVYQLKIADVEKEIGLLKSKIEQKDIELSKIENRARLTDVQLERVSYLKKEKEDLKSDIIRYEAKIDDLNQSKQKEYELYLLRVDNDFKYKEKDNTLSSIVFVILSIIVEFLILIGVYHNIRYNIKSFEEMDKELKNNPKYQQYRNAVSIIDIIYTDNTNINDKLPTTTDMLMLCKMNNVNVNQKEITSIMKLLNNLKVIKTKGGTRYFIKDKKTAEDEVKQYFRVK